MNGDFITFENWPEDFKYIRVHQQKMQRYYVKKMFVTLEGMIQRGRLLQLLNNIEERRTKWIGKDG